MENKKDSKNLENATPIPDEMLNDVAGGNTPPWPCPVCGGAFVNRTYSKEVVIDGKPTTVPYIQTECSECGYVC